MRREQQIDECDQCVPLRGFPVAAQELGSAFLNRVLIGICADPAHNRPTLRVERQEPARAVRIDMQLVTFF
ncbi:hypothetical protein MPPM_1224 [Methylorubrum populi]|uniref:Uncharacterized protein n=1 Tax=Methylorubrum populi TaxID=223967 RepID=A0A160PAQ7_9HYPH|nr:hypothetical protein MPPM_1224 [Methylorubrum populi]